MEFYNEINFASKAREKMLKGVSTLAEAVKTTLGPCGRNVVIENPNRTVNITKDGVTVAKNIILKDHVERLGSELVKEVANRAANIAGDGTTTATVLAEKIYRSGLSAIDKGINATELKRGIDAAVNIIIKKINEQSLDVSDHNQIIQIATISANGDKEIGKIIADAVNAVGIDGTVTVNQSKTSETYYNIVEGMEFANGYLSPYFINEQTKGTVEFDNCLVLLYGKKISTIQEILPALQQASQMKQPLLIVADDIEQEVLSVLVINKMKGVMSVAAVKSPGFGEIRKEIMLDIAALTDGTYISEDLGMTLESVKESQFGIAKHVTLTVNNCTIISDAEQVKIAVDARIAVIKQEMENATNEYAIKNCKRRLSKLTNGVAVINVGANSVVELGEKKDRVDDALCATRAAISEGIVPGGGSALVNALKLSIKELNELKKNNSEAFKYGIEIIENSIQEPIKQIAKNGNYSGDVIFNKVYESKKPYFGFNAAKGEYVNDMIKEGIIDPAKVVKTALSSAASVAGLLLTTEACITFEEEDDLNTIIERAMPVNPQGR